MGGIARVPADIVPPVDLNEASIEWMRERVVAHMRLHPDKPIKLERPHFWVSYDPPAWGVATAGEHIEPGDAVRFGEDGLIYRA